MPSLAAKTPTITQESVLAAQRGAPVESVGRCPCCGASMRLVKPLVDTTQATISWGGNFTRVGYVEVKLLDILARRYPSVATNALIYDHLYALDDDPPNDNTIKVHVTKLRRKLAAIGLTIRNHWGVGYALEAVS